MNDIKEKMIQIIKEQPEDSTYDEIMRELAFKHMIDKGLQDSEGNKTVSNAEMKKKIESWRK